jgi:TonB-linked SusC/RagA family outer membrane protein
MGGTLSFRRAASPLAALCALAFSTSVAAAQNAVVTGRVTSSGGQPLGGANVAIPELGVGSIADATGHYTFTVDVLSKSGRAVNVVARYIGYKPKRLPITLTAGRVEHDFVLDRDVLNLEEVVVTGTSEATSQKKTPFSVAVVDNAQIREVPSPTPLGVIEGKVPGASVISTSGQPGGEPSIRLRAATSLTGRQDPLIMVDGTITRLGLADINSEDIERIEIVKGAAASSLYGSDAANGVIQIFTKRGANLAEGQTMVNVRNEIGDSYLPHLIQHNMHNNYQLLDPNDPSKGFDFSSGSRTAKADLIVDNPYPVTYDQYRKVFRPGQKLTNYISLGQRRGTSNYNASFENEHDQGVLRLLDGYRRQNFRVNVDQSVTENLDMGVGAFYGRSTAKQADNWFGLFFGMLFLEPNVNIDSIVKACPGTTVCSYVGEFNPVVRQPPLSGNVDNPLYDLQVLQKNNDRDRFTGTYRASYRPLRWLTADGNAGYDESNQMYKSFTPVGYTNSSGADSKGSLYTQNTNDRSYNINVSLTSTLQLTSAIHNTTKLAGLYEDQTNNWTDVNASQLTLPKVPEFGSADPGGTIRPGSRTEVIRAKDAFLVSTFDIKDRYVLDALVREDQSSLFGSKQRNATYHRLSAAYRVTQDFHIPAVDELKLRVSHGTAGLRPPFTAQYETFSIVAGSPVKVTLGNNELKPAFSRETEYGFNVNFLTNYSLDYSYSTKRTTDEIIQVPLSGATGYQQQWQNAGTLSGKSHELALGAVLLSRANSFWRVNITADRTRQKIEDLKVPPFFVGPDPNDANTRIFRIAANQPFGVIYGSKWIKTADQLQQTINAGMLTGTTADYVVNEEGYYVRKSQYHTIGEVPLKEFFCESSANGVCTAAQSVQQIGNVNPDFNLGLNSTLQWKSLNFSGTLTWTKGGQIYNYTRQWPFNELRDKIFDQSDKPAVTPACPANWESAAPTCPYSTGRKPSSYYSSFYNNFDPNEFFVEDGSFVRLRELAVNWSLPTQWTTRLPFDFRTVRLGVVGRNLWTSTKYSGYDPDVTGPGGGNPFAYRVDYFTYPAYRTFTAMLEFGY